jgi:hypothetical protein
MDESHPKSAPRLSRGVAFFGAAAALTVFLYWMTLSVVHPGYFAPLSPFHTDFYDAWAAGKLPFFTLLSRWPRPVTYLGVKVYALGGLTGVMAGGIVVALLNLLLGLALARKMLNLESPLLLAAYGCWAFLLFAHPQFYIAHRHDGSGQISLFFFLVSMVAWVYWTKRPSFLTLPVALIAAILFAFAKETYFVSAFCIVLGLALGDAVNRRLHLLFGGYLVIVEAASFAWNNHLKGPFVNLNSAQDDPYKIVLTPYSLARSYHYYVAQLLNPALILCIAAGIWLAWRQRTRLILLLSIIAAGFAAYVPHAVLPNHMFEEYAYVGAALVLVPVLLASTVRHLMVLAALILLTIFGPLGYRGDYKGFPGQFWVMQDKNGKALLDSLTRLELIPRPSRILVTGLLDPDMPWQDESYLRARFGPDTHWTVALPPEATFRRQSELATFANLADVHLNDFDYLASYHGNGNIDRIRAAGDIAATEYQTAVFIPDLIPLMDASHMAAKKDYMPDLKAAALCAQWGLPSDTEKFLESAQAHGAADSTFRKIAGTLPADLQNKLEAAQPPAFVVPAALFNKPELTANPPNVTQHDSHGLGMTELFWRLPPGVSGQIRVDGSDGTLFAAVGNSGSVKTGQWVTNGMEFFLQDVTAGKSLTIDHTLAVVKVTVSP